MGTTDDHAESQAALVSASLNHGDAAACVGLLDDAVVEVLDPRLASIQVEANAGEGDDDNRPKHLHNAVELFVKTGQVEHAQKVQRCTAVFFALIEGRCTNENAVTGRACICWRCGHCGLERRSATGSQAGLARMCNNCEETEQTNFVMVAPNDGVSIAWREMHTPLLNELQGLSIKTLSEEEQREAKRAVIAASVKAAREAQGDVGAAAAKQVVVDGRLTSIQIIPNGKEEEHPNFPQNLYKALELLLKVGHTSCAQRLQQYAAQFFGIVDEGPQAAGRRGQGFLCFECGYVGLVPEPTVDKASEKACFCTSCGDGSHTNLVKLVLPNGQELPWMERG